MASTQGLLLVFTGHGKGKTTAALGMSMRAAGNDMPVCFIQFIKGAWKYGELDGLARFEDLIDLHVMGRGFTWKSDDPEHDRALAQGAWDKAKEAIFSGKYQLVVLDEFTYLLSYRMIELSEVLDVLGRKPPELHVVITGRDAAGELIELADLVTEMQVVKHPYQQGIKAQRGVEY
ncbi:cob(I)yrinic acid a,c-diamide adenosyltransferase [Desulfogranum mediterraneum]|uniref:cob(I)yrinic acid a,c-diamide adenosyltransferase n=1 Tax=Desulfogranum mediterraneum TaxID=160661 RepID=UPI00048AF63F|nr:cob(I)yrinic acid a,c-diamide adenosyltransferase [Desulfogranum mediterraneum]